jgi:hypothetical protein
MTSKHWDEALKRARSVIEESPQRGDSEKWFAEFVVEQQMSAIDHAVNCNPTQVARQLTIVQARCTELLSEVRAFKSNGVVDAGGARVTARLEQRIQTGRAGGWRCTLCGCLHPHGLSHTECQPAAGGPRPTGWCSCTLSARNIACHLHGDPVPEDLRRVAPPTGCDDVSDMPGAPMCPKCEDRKFICTRPASHHRCNIVDCPGRSYCPACTKFSRVNPATHCSDCGEGWDEHDLAPTPHCPPLKTEKARLDPEGTATGKTVLTAPVEGAAFAGPASAHVDLETGKRISLALDYEFAISAWYNQTRERTTIEPADLKALYTLVGTLIVRARKAEHIKTVPDGPLKGAGRSLKGA